MEEPSPRKSRLVLAGGLAAAIVVGGAGFLLGRGTTERTQVVVAPPAAEPASKPVSVPEPSALAGPLGRSDLINLTAAAADATAAGRPLGADVAQAAGRRFELRLPFGCSGPAAENSGAAMRWRYDAEDQALRFHVDPVTWSGDEWWTGASATAIETIKGFWITRPWTGSEACPMPGERTFAPGAEPVTLPGQTLAVGQVFFAQGARGGSRDDEPYEAVVRVPEDELNTSEGFRLRVSGRIAGNRGIGPVQCRQPGGPEQRPICLVSVVMDEVAIENPASGETLATWNVARAHGPEG